MLLRWRIKTSECFVVMVEGSIFRSLILLLSGWRVQQRLETRRTVSGPNRQTTLKEPGFKYISQVIVFFFKQNLEEAFSPI